MRRLPKRTVSYLIIKRVLSRKGIGMPEGKKCKSCNKPIDGSGDFCSDCRIVPRAIDREGLSSSELTEAYRQGDRMREKLKDDADRYWNNPC